MINWKKIFFLKVIFFSSLSIFSQESIVTSGGNASSNTGTVSYSIGQVTYSTSTGSSGTISEGVQQPFEIMVVNGLNELKNISLDISAYPNPVVNQLILKINNDYVNQKLDYHLVDENGRLIDSKLIDASEKIIDMSNLPSSVYFLKVMKEKVEVISFKIVKNA